MIKFILLIIFFLPLVLIALSVFYGMRLYSGTSTAKRATAIALIASAIVGSLIYVQQLLFTSHSHDDWGLSVLAAPLLALAGLPLSFSIIWPLIIITFIVNRKLSKAYFVGALIMLILPGVAINSFMKYELLPIKAAKGKVTPEEIHHWLDLDRESRNNNPQWLRDSLDGALRNPKLPETVLGDYVEHKYSNVDAIVRHPNMTPELLDKMFDKGYSAFNIASNKKTSAETLSRMYGKSTDFYTREHIVNHANAPVELSTEFVNMAIADKDRNNAYRAIANNRRIPIYLFKKMSKDNDWKMRLAVADNYYAPVDIVEKLIEDKDQTVSYRAKENLRLRDSARKEIEGH